MFKIGPDLIIIIMTM